MKANTRLYKVRLNSQGYTSEGYYFGVGQQLWRWEFEDGVEFESGYVRAPNRKVAKIRVIDYAPVGVTPTFYR